MADDINFQYYTYTNGTYHHVLEHNQMCSYIELDTTAMQLGRRNEKHTKPATNRRIH